MYSSQKLRRRIISRRSALLVGFLLVITISYIQLWQNVSLPNVNDQQDAEESYKFVKLDTEEAMHDPVFSLDLQEPSLSQEQDFKEMRAFKEMKFFFNNELVGRVTKGESSNNFTHESLKYQRENATFFSLVRNEDFKGIANAVQSVEYRFNSAFHYDWVFANDKPFDPSFVRIIQNLVSGNAHFVEIPQSLWSYPEWIDQKKANETRIEMKNNKVKYGDSEAYRHMCRFNSGFFYRLPIMNNYKYYWRVEPDIEFQCDLFHTDWFRFMRENKKKYAFTLAPLELHTTVTNLWETVQQFSSENPQLIAENNNMAFLSEDEGHTYNMCHFWSNFEIGDLDFYRLEAYLKFFDHIDKAGGFYYSRWGDAPVHSMAVSLLLNKDELMFLDNSGYFHSPNGDCPWDPQIRRERRCTCQTKKDATWVKSSCIPKWFEIHNIEKPPFVPKYKFVNQHKPPKEEEEKEPEEEDND